MTIKLDQAETVFFSRQLETIRSETYDEEFPEIKNRALVPVNFKGTRGTTQITYRSYTKYGMAKIIATGASDLPRVDIKGTEHTARVYMIGDSYGYDLNEIWAAQESGMALDQAKASAAKEANYRLENDLCFFGSEQYNMQGFFNNPNIPVLDILDDGTGSSTTFESKKGDPEKILRDMNAPTTQIKKQSKGRHMANTALLPIDQLSLIKTTPYTTSNDTTILDMFLNSNPEITDVDWVNELAAVDSAGNLAEDGMMVYKRDPKILEQRVTMDFTQRPEQWKGIQAEIPCIQKYGGVQIMRPLACCFVPGV